MFSQQEYICCVCGTPGTRVCDHLWDRGVCSIRCLYEKDWRTTLSIMNSAYQPDKREYDERGFPIEIKLETITPKGFDFG